MNRIIVTALALITGFFALVFSLIIAIPLTIAALITGKRIEKTRTENAKKKCMKSMSLILAKPMPSKVNLKRFADNEITVFLFPLMFLRNFLLTPRLAPQAGCFFLRSAFAKKGSSLAAFGFVISSVLKVLNRNHHS